MLTSAEYSHVIRGRSVLQDKIDQAERDKQEYDALLNGADRRKDQLELEMEFYVNYMADAIAEYEAAHQGEPE